MDEDLKTSTWRQFGAAIDMLDSAMTACPDELWAAPLWQDANTEDEKYTEFWWRAFHTLRWLDLYLTGTDKGFLPPAPFKNEGLPAQPYTKPELRNYLEHCRAKCQATLEGLTDEKARQRCKFDWLDVNFFELQLYNMRHVQEHAAQLNMILGQKGISVGDWIPTARDKAA